MWCACSDLLQLSGVAGSVVSFVSARLMSGRIAPVVNKESILNTRLYNCLSQAYLLNSVITLWHILIKGVCIKFYYSYLELVVFISPRVHDRCPSRTAAGIHAALP